MIQLKHRAKSRKTLLALGFVFLFANFLSVLSPLVPAAHAEPKTDAEKQACFNKYNGVNVQTLSAQDQAKYRDDCLGYCQPQPNNDNVISCPDPTAATTAAAFEAEIAPLVKLACGVRPQGGAGVPLFDKCIDQVRDIYITCSDTGHAGATQFPADDTARCAVPKINALPPINKITVNNAIIAINTGRKAAEVVVAADATARAKKACEDQGGTWANGTCTPKGAELVCSAGALGWLICPLIDLARDLSGAVAGLLDKLLKVEPLVLAPDPSSPNYTLYKAWQNLLTIGNLVLMVAFIIIIYSQATSAGLSAYGIKKILPRIVAAAIFINISYFLCAAAVDISNIVGSNITNLILATTGGAGTSDGSYFETTIGGLTSGIIVGGAAIGLVILIFTVYSTVALAILTVFLTIAIRNAAVVLLIMVSPLAFAAWVLPNTEKYFKQWLQLFTTMLALYPMVMAVFAAATVASQVIAAGAGNNVGLLAVALMIQVIVLGALPAIFGAANKTLGTASKALNSTGNKGRERYRKSEFGQYRGMKNREDERAMMAGNYRAKKLQPWTWQRGIRSRANQTLNKSGLFNAATRGYGGHRVLGEGRARSEDQETTAKYIGDDYTLAYAWARSGGSLKTAIDKGYIRSESAPNGEEHAAYRARFKEMERAGLGKKADSYIAASKIAASAGYGDMDMLRDAQRSIRETQPNVQQAIKDQADLEHGNVIPTWRGKGRGDLVGWEQVDAAATSRHAFGGPDGPQHVADLGTYLHNNEEKLREYAAKYDTIEARAKPYVQDAISQATGGQSVDQVRERFGLRVGGGGGAAPPPAAPAGGGGTPGAGPTGGGGGGAAPTVVNNNPPGSITIPAGTSGIYLSPRAVQDIEATAPTPPPQGPYGPVPPPAGTVPPPARNEPASFRPTPPPAAPPPDYTSGGARIPGGVSAEDLERYRRTFGDGS